LDSDLDWFRLLVEVDLREMGRLKPSTLLQQSKKKKGPARLNIATIVVVGVVIVLVLASAVVLHRQKSRENMTGDEVYRGHHQLDVVEGGAENTDDAEGGQFERYATLNTTKGSFTIELFKKDAPLAVENFVTHSKKGYYNGLLFHRVIKDFIIQTGDPKGDGTGGESIWGDSFNDEFKKELTHDPFTVSMANIGKANSNRSQFFITTTATPHLDMKHTVFGRVIRGQEVVRAIENVETDHATDKPLTPVYLKSITILEELPK
jgi:peptidylprolyl isomerase domain and WD repeat-containing protein 1